MARVYAPSVFGSFFVVAATMGQEIGQYYACARVSQVPPPPVHAVNRGMLISGLSQIMIAFCGVPISCETLAAPVGAIAVSQVSTTKDYTIQLSHLIMSSTYFS